MNWEIHLAVVQLTYNQVKSWKQQAFVKKQVKDVWECPLRQLQTSSLQIHCSELLIWRVCSVSSVIVGEPEALNLKSWAVKYGPDKMNSWPSWTHYILHKSVDLLC